MVSKYNYHYYTGGGDFMGRRNVVSKDKKGHPGSNREILPESRRLKTLWIANLSREMTEYKLIVMFKPFGEIERTQYAWHTGGDRKGEPKGYAFIEYKNQEDAEKAMEEMHGKEVLGRPLVVSIATDESETQNANISSISSNSSSERLRNDLTKAGNDTTGITSTSHSFGVTIGNALDFGIGTSGLSTEDRLATVEAQLKTMIEPITDENGQPLSDVSDDDELLGFKPYKSLHVIQREVEEAEREKKRALEAQRLAVSGSGTTFHRPDSTIGLASAITTSQIPVVSTTGFRTQSRGQHISSDQGRSRGRDDYRRDTNKDENRDRYREGHREHHQSREYDRDVNRSQSDRYKDRENNREYQHRDSHNQFRRGNDHRERDRDYADKHDFKKENRRHWSRDLNETIPLSKNLGSDTIGLKDLDSGVGGNVEAGAPSIHSSRINHVPTSSIGQVTSSETSQRKIEVRRRDDSRGRGRDHGRRESRERERYRDRGYDDRERPRDHDRKRSNSKDRDGGYKRRENEYRDNRR